MNSRIGEGRWFQGACGVCTCLLLLACGPESSEESTPVSTPSPVSSAPPAQVPPESPVSPVQGDEWYVSTKGSDSGTGSSTAPLRTLGEAVRRAGPGDVIRVQPGVYEESLTLGSLGATAAAVTLRGEGSERPRLIPGPQRQGAVVRVRGRWNLENLNIDVKNAPVFAVLFESTAHRSTLSDCELEDGSAGSGVVVEGAHDITLQRNFIHHFNKPDDDAHGVTVVGPAKNTLIQGNDIHHNSGDSIQCQAGSAPAVGLRIERNLLHDEGENGVDIKRCHDVTVRSNTFGGFPNRSIRPTGTSAGEAVVIHESARRISVLDNDIARAGRGISILGDGDEDTQDILLEDNRIEQIRNSPPGNGQGIRIESARNVKVLGNVVKSTASYGLMLAADGRAVTGFEVRNNTVHGSPGALLVRLGRAAHRPGLIMRDNAYATGGILKSDGVAEGLTGTNASYRSDFPGEQLTLSSATRLDIWKQVVGVDEGSRLVE